MTPLETAHAAMGSDETEAGRTAYLTRLAQAELFLWLEEAEATSEKITPRLLDTEDGLLALVFDTEEKLSALGAEPQPYATLSGRQIARMLVGQDIGLGVNLTDDASAFVLDPDGVGWLAERTALVLHADAERLGDLEGPNVTAPYLSALDSALSATAGLADYALLAQRPVGPVVFVVGAVSGAEDAIAMTVSEALALSGQAVERTAMIFVNAGTPEILRIARVAMRIDIPAASAPAISIPDPAKPPKLR